MIAWNDNWIKEQQKKYAQRVEAAAIHLTNEVKLLISIPSRTVTRSPTRIKKVLGARGSSRSTPGNPPHLDYGNLRRSIAHDMNAETLSARVGSAMEVAKFLEFGTSRMAARPFLRRSLKEQSGRIRQIIEHGATSDIKVG